MAIDTKGKVLYTDFSKMTEEEKESQAEVFSEGSKELKKILLYLWANNIQTMGCCAGHEDGKSMPYVVFDIKNLSDVQLKNLLVNLTQKNVGVQQTSFIKGGRASYPIYDKVGNEVGFEEKDMPTRINILCNGTFEEGKIYDILKSSIEDESEAELNEVSFRDKMWINNVIAANKLNLKKLNFNKYLEVIQAYNRMRKLDGKVSIIRINRDDSAVEYEDNYELINNETESRMRNEAAYMNKMLRLIPTGSIIETPEERLKMFFRIEKELKQYELIKQQQTAGQEPFKGNLKVVGDNIELNASKNQEELEEKAEE